MAAGTTPHVFRYVGRIIHVMRKERGMRQSELASLTGLKQPNLSRIENGVVVPRRSTLKKIAEALDVEVKDLLSDTKAQEVETKWGAALSPKNAGLIFSGKLTAVPLYESVGRSIFDDSGSPNGQHELTLQLPPLRGRIFAVRVPDRSMETVVSNAGEQSFRKGEILVFSDGMVRSGDYGFVVTNKDVIFRKLIFEGPRSPIQLMASNPNGSRRAIDRENVQTIWKLVHHIRSF